MKKREEAKLTWLGASKTKYPTKPSYKIIETFQNKNPRRNYNITFECSEYTSVCPITGQPDFAKIVIEYIPDKHCIESKSLKLYIFSYRNIGIFFETAVNNILDDLVKACKPKKMTVIGDFNVRGGIGIKVEAKHPSSL